MNFDWKQALAGLTGGGLSGAGTGAALGAGNPLAALIGALLGGTAGGLAGGFGGGEEGGFKKTSITTPEQNNIFDLLLRLGSQNLQNPYQGFEPIKQNALSTFFQDIVPGLTTRFAGSGSNAISSPVLHSQLSQAGATLAERLAGLQSLYGQQNQQNALRQLGLGLTPQFQTYYQQRQPGFGENILKGSIAAAPAAFQAYNQNKLLEKLTSGGMGK